MKENSMQQVLFHFIQSAGSIKGILRRNIEHFLKKPIEEKLEIPQMK